MKITYSIENADILFGLLFIRFPLRSELTQQKNTFILEIINEEPVSGIEKVLTKFYELCKCEPHDFAIINPEIIKEVLKVHKSPFKQTLKTLLANKSNNTKMSENTNNVNNNNNTKISEKSNIQNNHNNTKISENKEPKENILDKNYFLNSDHLTIADLTLFSKTYKSYKKGDKFSPEETEYLKFFQKVLKNKATTIYDCFAPDIKDIRIQVGKITEISDHPNADKLYVEKVLLNEETRQTITVCSGLKGIIDKSSLLNNNFLFVTNLKPNKLRGVASEGMILCVKNENGNLEVIKAPKLAKIGALVEIKHAKTHEVDIETRYLFEKNEYAILDAKNHIFVRSLAELHVDDGKVFFGKNVLSVSDCEIKTDTLKGKVS
ncbi:methionine-tRNA ligase, beta subunit, partial [Edhazardia aedis USNM 41457]